MRFVSYVSVRCVRKRVSVVSRTPVNCEIMKKNKHHNSSEKKKSVKIVDEKKPDNTEKSTAKPDSLDDEEQGFGGWLRSSDGLDTMKLFVIANSIVMLTTLVYPQIQTAFQIVYEMIYGIDALY